MGNKKKRTRKIVYFRCYEDEIPIGDQYIQLPHCYECAFCIDISRPYGKEKHCSHFGGRIRNMNDSCSYAIRREKRRDKAIIV